MMAASHCSMSNVIKTRQESERTKSCGFCNRIHCSYRCEYSECRSILLGGGYYGPFTVFRGAKAAGYTKVSREHETAALLPGESRRNLYGGLQKPFRRNEEKHILPGGNRTAIPRSYST